MGKFLIFGVVVLGLSANAKQIKVSGELARDLIEVGAPFGISEGAAGHVYLSAKATSCSKTVNATEALIVCSTTNSDGTESSLASNDKVNPEAPSRLRRLLNQITKADKKISSTEKVVKVTALECNGINVEHELDSLDLEPVAQCTLTY